MGTTCVHLNEAEIKGDRDSAIRCPYRDPSRGEYSGKHGAEVDRDAGERIDAFQPTRLFLFAGGQFPH